MYKKMIKSAAGVILSLSLAVASCGMTANAADDVVNGNIEGVLIRGKITIDNMSATATTTFSRNASISSTAAVYFWLNDTYYRVKKDAFSGAGGATAVATKNVGGADVVGGKGTHKVEFGSYKWGPKTTKVGNTLLD